MGGCTTGITQIGVAGLGGHTPRVTCFGIACLGVERLGVLLGTKMLSGIMFVNLPFPCGRGDNGHSGEPVLCKCERLQSTLVIIIIIISAWFFWTEKNSAGGPCQGLPNYQKVGESGAR